MIYWMLDADIGYLKPELPDEPKDKLKTLIFTSFYAPSILHLELAAFQ